MCFGGGGPAGPTVAELVAREQAAAERARAESDRLNSERDLAKQQENARMVADQAALANADAARRVRNRTLLAGFANEEDTNPLTSANAKPLDTNLEDPTAPSAKKAKRATLLGGL